MHGERLRDELALRGFKAHSDGQTIRVSSRLDNYHQSITYFTLAFSTLKTFDPLFLSLSLSLSTYLCQEFHYAHTVTLPYLLGRFCALSMQASPTSFSKREVGFFAWQAWQAWQNFQLRARDKYLFPTYFHFYILQQGHSRSSTKASLTLISLCNYTTALSYFWLIGYLYNIFYTPTSHNTFFTPLGPVPAHPTLSHTSLSLSDELLSTPELAGILRSTAILTAARKRRLNVEQIAEVYLCYDLSSL